MEQSVRARETKTSEKKDGRSQKAPTFFSSGWATLCLLAVCFVMIESLRLESPKW